jgi:hypothetical protein
VSLGFAARGTSEGEGDGNGIIEGIPGPHNPGLSEQGGETLMFWVDLSAAKMIPESFTSASSTVAGISGSLSAYFPIAAVGQSSYVYLPMSRAPFLIQGLVV